MAELDKDAIREIEIFMDSDRRIYATIRLVHKNLINKMASGKYNPDQAAKAFIPIIIRSEALYQKEYGGNKKTLLSGKERTVIAIGLKEYFEAEAVQGHFKDLLHKKYQK